MKLEISINAIKNRIKSFNSRTEKADGKMSDPGDKTCEITQSGENKHGIIK